MSKQQYARFYGWFSIVCTVLGTAAGVAMLASIAMRQAAFAVPSMMGLIGFFALAMVSSRIYWLIRAQMRPTTEGQKRD